MRQRVRFVILVCVALAAVLECSACQPKEVSSSATSFREVAQPYRFNFFQWEVAAFTGWQNQFYFSNSFRRHYGIAPSRVPIHMNKD